MKLNRTGLRAAATVAVLASASVFGMSASAATITFDGLGDGTEVDLGQGLQADDIRIVDGNCLANDCLALNKNETTTITRPVDQPFSLSSLWFQLLGEKSVLTITASNGFNTSYNVEDYGHNDGGQTLNFGDALKGVTFVKFADTSENAGNIRIDTLSVGSISTVPVPAAGFLLLAGLGGLAALRRRKSL